LTGRHTPEHRVFFVLLIVHWLHVYLTGIHRVVHAYFLVESVRHHIINQKLVFSQGSRLVEYDCVDQARLNDFLGRSALDCEFALEQSVERVADADAECQGQRGGHNNRNEVQHFVHEFLGAGVQQNQRGQRADEAEDGDDEHHDHPLVAVGLDFSEQFTRLQDRADQAAPDSQLVGGQDQTRSLVLLLAVCKQDFGPLEDHVAALVQRRVFHFEALFDDWDAFPCQHRFGHDAPPVQHEHVGRHLDFALDLDNVARDEFVCVQSLLGPVPHDLHRGFPLHHLLDAFGGVLDVFDSHDYLEHHRNQNHDGLLPLAVVEPEHY